MKTLKDNRVKVIVKRNSGDFVSTLSSLLEQAKDEEIREIMGRLDSVKLIRVAASVHGRLYKRILGQE